MEMVKPGYRDRTTTGSHSYGYYESWKEWGADFPRNTMLIENTHDFKKNCRPVYPTSCTPH